ncbi:MAG: M20/M25/M40 family metallo-hydrolase [bacterium]
MHRIYIVLLLCAMIATCLFSQADPVKKGLESITIDAVKGQLEFLASDWTMGRETGEKGLYIAADYIASMFKVYGVKPAGDREGGRGGRSMFMSSRNVRMPEPVTTYFQNYPLVSTESVSDPEFVLIDRSVAGEKSLSFPYRSDFQFPVTSYGINFTAPIVFIGYGLTDEKNGYDDLKGIDLKGKFVIRISGFPGSKDTTSPAYKKFRPAEQPAQMQFPRQQGRGGGRNQRLEQLGVLGVLDVNVAPDMLLRNATNYPFRFNTAFYEGDEPLSSSGRSMRLVEDSLSGGVVSITISQRIFNEIFEGSGISLEEFEKQVAKTMKPASKVIPNKFISLKSSVKSKIIHGRNVIGVIEGESKEEIIVVGGHYDHMGMRKGYIYNGADDNASGTVGVMTIAKAFAATGVKPKKTVVFAAWSGEEEGLLGSAYFVSRPSFGKFQNIILNLNYDMISRDADNDTLKNNCGYTYTEAFPMLKEIVEKANKDYNVSLNLNIRSAPRPGGGSDHASFSAKDIPVMSFMAAMHPDYHQPMDHVDKVNFEKMTKIIKIGFLSIWDLANSDAKLKK